MIIGPILESGSPAAIGIFAGAGIWLMSMLIVVYHKAGMQVLGAFLAAIGFVMLIANIQIILALSLLTFGFCMHGCGRLLFRLRRRD